MLSLLISNIGNTREIDIGEGHQLQYSGYVGWQQIFSDRHLENTFSRTGTPELGLNVVYNRDKFQIFNQFRYGEDSETVLVYNFMQYTFNLADDVNLSLRGGKLRHELGLYNSTRVNPRTRQGVIQPQSIYWDVFDEFLTSGVGVGVVLQWKDLELSYTIDDPTISDNKKTTRAFYASILNSTNTSFGSHQTASLTYSPSSLPLLFKASWAHLDFGNDTGIGMALFRPQYIKTNVTAEQISFGLEYKIDRLILSGETMWFKEFDQEWSKDFSEMSNQFSVSAIYQLTDNLDLRLNYNEGHGNLSKEIFPPQQQWKTYREDLNVGLKYHITTDLMVQGEAHYINGSRTIDSADVAYDKDKDPWVGWWLVGTNVVYFF
jgi:hypothetical protein